MDVRNCKNVDIFNYLSGPPLCPTCIRKLDDIFDEVKEYIYDHPRVDMRRFQRFLTLAYSRLGNGFVRETLLLRRIL